MDMIKQKAKYAITYLAALGLTIILTEFARQEAKDYTDLD